MKKRYIALIVGVGGTGGNLSASLSRFLPTQWKMVLLDNDKVEDKNLSRQPYQKHDVGNFKAESLAKKISTATSADCEFINKYLLEEKQLDNIFNGAAEIAIFGCVDNHPARMIIEKWFSKNKDNFTRSIYIDSANELNNGQVVSVMGALQRSWYSDNNLCEIIKENMFFFRSDIYPEVKRSKKGNKADKKCNQEISKGNTQQYATNYQAANIMFQIFNLFIGSKYKNIPNQVLFNLEKWGMSSV